MKKNLILICMTYLILSCNNNATQNLDETADSLVLHPLPDTANIVVKADTSKLNQASSANKKKPMKKSDAKKKPTKKSKSKKNTAKSK